jgi:hypothetical protein
MSKVATYSRITEKREDGTTIYWRSGQGNMRHASFYCINSKRSIFTGDCLVIPADEVEQWTPCADCCTEADVTTAAQAAAAKAAANCRNSGVVHPGRISSYCKDCGKGGTVIRGRGTLRAHKPLNAPKAAPAAAPAPAAPEGDELDSLTFPALMEIAKQLKVAGRGTARRPQLIEGIRAARAAR